MKLLVKNFTQAQNQQVNLIPIRLVSRSQADAMVPEYFISPEGLQIRQVVFKKNQIAFIYEGDPLITLALFSCLPEQISEFQSFLQRPATWLYYERLSPACLPPWLNVLQPTDSLPPNLSFFPSVNSTV